MIPDLVLFCKSYHKDMLRARRMADSVQRFNVDRIPLYMCVPDKDLSAFKRCFEGISCTFVTDETVLSASCRVHGALPDDYPRHLLQQLVKLEFWRLNTCRNYLWIDADSYFIREFRLSDFLDQAGVPYTIQHESEELFSFAATYDDSIIEDFQRMAIKFKRLFNRTGPLYNFGYSPLIWSCKVLKHLYEDFLVPRNQTIFTLLLKYPCEMQLYGEYLYYSKTIPIVTKKPLFKVYHYDEQFFREQEYGQNEYSLSKDYLGIVMQSNWASPKKRKTGFRIKLFIRKYRKRFKGFFDK